VSPALVLVSIGALGSLATSEPVRDTAWARALPEGTSVVLPAGHYVGPWRFTHHVQLKAEPGAILVPGITTDPGHATLTLESGGQVEGLTIEAPTKGYAMRVERSAATMRKLRLLGSGEAGLYFVGGALDVSDCDFEGNQYGVLSQGPSSLVLEESRFKGIYRAGVALVSTTATIKNNVFTGPFYEAAVTIIHGEQVKLSGTKVTAAGEIGLKFVGSSAAIDSAMVEGVRQDAHGLEGNGLYSYQSTLDVSGLRVDDTQGVGVSVSGGRVTLNHCELHRCSVAAVYVGGGGHLRLVDTLLADSPVGIFVESDATTKLEAVRYERVERRQEKGK
jgi:hypothetical protein